MADRPRCHATVPLQAWSAFIGSTVLDALTTEHWYDDILYTDCCPISFRTTTGQFKLEFDGKSRKWDLRVLDGDFPEPESIAVFSQSWVVRAPTGNERIIGRTVVDVGTHGLCGTVTFDNGARLVVRVEANANGDEYERHTVL